MSIWNTGNTSVNSISGTSMASPGVAGLVAYFLSLYPTTFIPTEADFLAAGLASPFETRRTHQIVLDSVKSALGYKVAGGKGKLPDILPPAVMKKAIERVGTKGILTSMPPETKNILVFNNATSCVCFVLRRRTLTSTSSL
jgi:cerevisin